ncbi:MAG: helix-turn-helix transcriptional regulator [Patescibacteria group bacterium]
MDNTSEFGKKVKKIRQAKGLSQTDVASKLSTDKSFISNLENGRKNPTLKTILSLAKALGVTVSELTR